MKNNKEIKFQLKTISLYYSISTLFIEILSYPLIEFGLVEHLIDESDEIKEKKKINEHLKGKNLLAWLDWYDKKNVSNFHQNKEIEQFIDYRDQISLNLSAIIKGEKKKLELNYFFRIKKISEDIKSYWLEKRLKRTNTKLELNESQERELSSFFEHKIFGINKIIEILNDEIKYNYAKVRTVISTLELSSNCESYMSKDPCILTEGYDFAQHNKLGGYRTKAYFFEDTQIVSYQIDNDGWRPNSVAMNLSFDIFKSLCEELKFESVEV